MQTQIPNISGSNVLKPNILRPEQQINPNSLGQQRIDIEPRVISKQEVFNHVKERQESQKELENNKNNLQTKDGEAGFRPEQQAQDQQMFHAVTGYYGVGNGAQSGTSGVGFSFAQTVVNQSQTITALQNLINKSDPEQSLTWQMAFFMKIRLTWEVIMGSYNKNKNSEDGIPAVGIRQIRRDN